MVPNPQELVGDEFCSVILGVFVRVSHSVSPALTNPKRPSCTTAACFLLPHHAGGCRCLSARCIHSSKRFPLEKVIYLWVELEKPCKYSNNISHSYIS